MDFNIELARFKRRLLEAERELEDCVAKLKDAKRFNREKDFLLFFDDELELEALERKLTSAREVATVLNKEFREIDAKRYASHIRGMNEVMEAFSISYLKILRPLIAEFKNDEAFEFWKKNVLHPYEPWKPWKQHHKEALVFHINWWNSASAANEAENERDFWDAAVALKRSQIRVCALRKVRSVFIKLAAEGTIEMIDFEMMY